MSATVWSHNVKVWGLTEVLMRKAHTAAAAQMAMCELLDVELKSMIESGTWKSERVIVTRQGPSIRVDGRQDPVLNFCANNYLGLSVSLACWFIVRFTNDLISATVL